MARANAARGASRRRARKKQLPATLTPEQETFARRYWHGGCAVCGRHEGLWHTIALDHWFALSTSASIGTTASNIIPLCHSKKGSALAGEPGCNTNKAARDPVAWLTAKLGPRKAKTKLREIERYVAAATTPAPAAPPAPVASTPPQSPTQPVRAVPQPPPGLTLLPVGPLPAVPSAPPLPASGGA